MYGFFDPFHATDLFLYPPPENIRKPRFSDVFMGYRKRPMA